MTNEPADDATTTQPATPFSRYPERPPGRLHATPLAEVEGASFVAEPVTPFDHAPRCGARTRDASPCLNPARRNGRCRMHGGNSTGARDPAKLAAAMRTAAARKAAQHGNAATVGEAVKTLQGLLVMRLGRLAELPTDQLDTHELIKLQRAFAGVAKVAKAKGVDLDTLGDEADRIRRELAEKLERWHAEPPATSEPD